MSNPSPAALDGLKQMLANGLINDAQFQLMVAALHGQALHGPALHGQANPSAVVHHGGVIAQIGSDAVASGVLIKGDSLADVLVNSVKIVVGKPDPAEEREWLAQYLNYVAGDCVNLKLEAIDIGTAAPGRRTLQLTDVYVGLNTPVQIPEDLNLADFIALASQPEKTPGALASLGEYFNRKVLRRGGPDETEKKTRPITVLEALAYHAHMVLLGVPGSGKSTVVSYAALHLAQACGGNPESLRALGPAWSHGAVLPIRVTLRQFAPMLAAKLNRGETPAANDVWAFIKADLSPRLAAPTVELIEKIARLQGALFLFDGLDEASSLPVRQAVFAVICCCGAGTSASARTKPCSISWRCQA